jgi:hypothetical protein
MLGLRFPVDHFWAGPRIRSQLPEITPGAESALEAIWAGVSCSGNAPIQNRRWGNIFGF